MPHVILGTWPSARSVNNIPTGTKVVGNLPRVDWWAFLHLFWINGHAESQLKVATTSKCDPYQVISDWDNF